MSCLVRGYVRYHAEQHPGGKGVLAGQPISWVNRSSRHDRPFVVHETTGARAYWHIWGTIMRHGVAVIAGIVAGAIGAAIWAAISYMANAEVGYIAWGIGFLTGYAVAYGAKDETDAITGVIAATCAVVAVLGGKYAAAHLSAQDAFHVMKAQMPQVTAELMFEAYAHEIAGDRAARGKPVQFAGNKKLEDVEAWEEFPADVQREAKQRWEKLPPAEQAAAIQKKADELKSIFQAVHGEVAQQAFMGSFGLFDLLWFFLAVGTAFRLGSGGSDE
jgi:hypothetical protein